LQRVRTARGADGIVRAVNEYLARWSADRVRKLQRFDGGHSPFDHSQQAIPIGSVHDVPRILESLHRHRVSLTDAGIYPARELLELEQFLHVARQVVTDHLLGHSSIANGS